MKREYKSPTISITMIAVQQALLIASEVVSNVHLKQGTGSSEEARSRESRLWLGNDEE